MSRTQVVRCLGCHRTDEKRSDNVRWFLRDVFAGIGVCSACTARRDYDVLRSRMLTEGAKARATTGVLE